MVKGGGFIFLVGVLLMMIFSSSVIAGGSFEVDNLLLKVNLKDLGSSERVISVSSSTSQEFSLEVIGLEGVSLSEYEFVLASGETKVIRIFFNSTGLDKWVYVGGIKITGSTEGREIPVVFELESEDLFFDLNLDIAPRYLEIKPGDNFVAQIKVFDLVSGGGLLEGLGSVSVDMEYFIYSFDGRLLASESESIVVDDQTQISKSFSFSDEVEEGQYVFVSIAKFKSSVGTSTRLFSIVGEEKFSGGNLFSEDSRFYSILGVVVLFFLGIIFLFVYILRDRDKIFLELKKDNRDELRRQNEILFLQGRVLRKKGKPVREIKKQVSKAKRDLKVEHKKKIKKIKELKKKGDNKKMLNQIREWKKKGYSTKILEYKLKGISTEEMKSLVRGSK